MANATKAEDELFYDQLSKKLKRIERRQLARRTDRPKQDCCFRYILSGPDTYCPVLLDREQAIHAAVFIRGFSSVTVDVLPVAVDFDIYGESDSLRAFISEE